MNYRNLVLGFLLLQGGLLVWAMRLCRRLQLETDPVDEMIAACFILNLVVGLLVKRGSV